MLVYQGLQMNVGVINQMAEGQRELVDITKQNAELLGGLVKHLPDVISMMTSLEDTIQTRSVQVKPGQTSEVRSEEVKPSPGKPYPEFGVAGSISTPVGEILREHRRVSDGSKGGASDAGKRSGVSETAPSPWRSEREVLTQLFMALPE